VRRCVLADHEDRPLGHETDECDMMEENPWEVDIRLLRERIDQLEMALRAVLNAGERLRTDDIKRRVDDWDEVAIAAALAIR
jgi:hypothetical protein